MEAAQAEDLRIPKPPALLESLERDGNDICADCSDKGPRWASINIGKHPWKIKTLAINRSVLTLWFRNLDLHYLFWYSSLSWCSYIKSKIRGS